MDKEKHGTKRRGWIKVHLAVDVETRKPVAFEITNEKIADHEISDRSESILEMKKLGYDSWKKIHSYGRRWAVEGVFSAIKRIFGETVRATSPEGMIKEAARMISSYCILLSL